MVAAIIIVLVAAATFQLIFSRGILNNLLLFHSFHQPVIYPQCNIVPVSKPKQNCLFVSRWWIFSHYPHTAITVSHNVLGSILKKWTENSRYSIIMMDTKTKEEKSMESKKNYHAAYDEDFKKSIVTLYQNGRTQSRFPKNMASQRVPSENGSSNTLLSEQRTERY